jgi:hypothetical protein
MMFCHSTVRVRLARQPNGLGDSAQVVVHDQDVGGFHGRVGPRRAHRDPDLAAASAGASLMPSPVMADRAVVLAQLPDCRQLVLGQQVGPHLVDAGLAGDGRRQHGVVAGQHQGGDTQSVQLSNGLAGALA